MKEETQLWITAGILVLTAFALVLAVCWVLMRLGTWLGNYGGWLFVIVGGGVSWVGLGVFLREIRRH